MFLLFVQKGNKYIEFVGVTSMLVIVKKIDEETIERLLSIYSESMESIQSNF